MWKKRWSVLLMRLSIVALLLPPFPDALHAASMNLILQEGPIDLISETEVIGQFLSFSIPDLTHADGSTEIFLATFDPTKARVTIEHTDRVVQMIDYFGIKACPGAILVASGGFFDMTNNTKFPIGLVLSQGQLTSQLAPWSEGGVFTVTGDRYSVHPIAQFQRHPGMTEAIQGLPILVRDGKNDLHQDDGKRWDRMSISITEQNEVMILAAFSREREAISLYNFALASLKAADLAGIKVRDSLALDGAGGAALNIRALRRHYGYQKDKYVPNVICIQPRSNETLTGQ